MGPSLCNVNGIMFLPFFQISYRTLRIQHSDEQNSLKSILVNNNDYDIYKHKNSDCL